MIRGISYIEKKGTACAGTIFHAIKKIGIVCVVFLVWIGCTGCRKQESQQEDMKKEAKQTESKTDEMTPFGRYDETVTYTLGKMTGHNNSNLPSGDTYENNAYTRYLKKKLNVQNVNLFEASDEDYAETVSMAIAQKEIPDVMVVNDMETLKMLVKKDMIADLTKVYESCASDRIKEIYESYGDNIWNSVTFDGKLMALPETNIEDGPSLLWLRKDWMDKLGIAEPKTMEDAEKIIQAFIENDMAGDGNTVGLVCDEELTGGAEYSYEYQTDIVFACYGSYPKKWIRNENGEVVYGTVMPGTKKGIKKLRQMYEEGILDQSFLLRESSNIIDLVTNGQCGSFFGPWWAPNNPLMEAVKQDEDAIWRPYLIQTDKDGSTSFATQNPSTKWVVVRKDYEHPEIIMKIVSVLFDKMKYENAECEEIAAYYQDNVDPTARPLSINIDYSDALLRCYNHIKETLNGNKSVSELEIVEGAYYESCYRYQRMQQSATSEDWAAYTSRVTACELLETGKTNAVEAVFFGETETMKTKWWNLRKKEKEMFLEIITGEKPLDYFDTFVKQWYEEGGETITKEVNEWVK